MKSPKKEHFNFSQLAKDGCPYDLMDIAFGLEALADGNSWHGLDNDDLNEVIRDAAKILRNHQNWRNKTNE